MEHATHSHADIQKHVKVYMMVFVALACLTAVTVGVAYMHLARPMAIGVALAIATVKAGLVAAYFMHLISEVKVIFWVLALTVVFFAVLMALPSLTLYVQGHV